VQRHEVRFVVDAPRHHVWRALHPKPRPGTPTPRVFEYPHGRLEVLVEGGDAGRGLVRTCEFRVPRWLGTRGVGRSWEVVTEARVDEYSRYEAVCKPLWAKIEGCHELEERPDGRTGLTFVETFDTFSPLVRRLFEKRVHAFISKDNDHIYETVLRHCGTVERVLV
jgi:hypothetical protein